MCGITAVLLADTKGECGQELFDALILLQHRGQDAAGIVTVRNGTVAYSAHLPQNTQRPRAQSTSSGMCTRSQTWGGDGARTLWNLVARQHTEPAR
jgi:glutamine phosphoribosylpyrophosphate amidotransferase